MTDIHETGVSQVGGITYVDLNVLEAGQPHWLSEIARERVAKKREEHRQKLRDEAPARMREYERKRRRKKFLELAGLKFNPNHDELGRFSSGDGNGNSSDSSGGSSEQRPTSSSSANGGGGGGGLSGTSSGVESSGAADSVSTERLSNSPTSANVPGVGKVEIKPNIKIRQAAADYCKKAGIKYEPPTEYVKVDVDRAKKIANAYEEMPNNPHDPEVKAAYEALAKETIAQYQAALDSGLKVNFIDPAKGDPYAASPRLAILDIQDNNHFSVFPTIGGGFGSDANFDASDNPLLTPTEYKIDGKVAVVNDLFRVVHDYFGHAKEMNGMRADGEENAWRSHSAMFSPLARRAMTSETRGQNSWVNFGPHAEANKTASGGDTHYADQKIGLLPEWVVSEGAKAFEFIQFTKSLETKIARAAVKAAKAAQHARVEREAARDFATYFQQSVADIVSRIPSFKPDPENAKAQADKIIKRAFKASKQNDLLIKHASQPVVDAFLEGAYAELRLQGAAKRRKKGLKYNENHDEAGRFASGSGSGGYAGSVNDEHRAKMILGIKDDDDVKSYIGKTLGLPQGTHIDAEAYSSVNIIKVDAESTFGEGVQFKCRRYIEPDDKTIENNTIEIIAKGERGHGVGTDILAAQVKEAAANGFETIKVYAAGGPNSPWNGYYTWPRLGFDGKLDSSNIGPKLVEEVKQKFTLANPDEPRVSDLMKTPEGRAWWKNNGTSIHVKFDLREGSQSRKVLDAYVKAKRESSGKSTGTDSGGGSSSGSNLGQSKFNENHDELGRFSSGDGESGDSGAKPHVTETPEFKAWFKDSKVVDDSGKPLVVYHGTNGEFDTFDESKIGSTQDQGFWGRGFYFIDSKEWAQGYAEDAGPKPVVKEAFLAMQNPYYWSQKDQDDRPKWTVENSSKIAEEDAKWVVDFTNRIKEAGHDGVIVRGEPGNPTEYVVFKPTQIKSTANEGKFDPSNPDIRKSHGVKITTAAQAARRAEQEIDFPTTAPDWLTEAAQDFIISTFQEDYWLRIPETTRDDIANTLYEAIRDGKSIKQIANEIRANHGDEYSKSRAMMVARTETTGALSAGANESIRQAYEGTGLTPTKVWLSVLGATTRDTHAEADGQEVLLDAEFTVGGEQCSYPGDARLSAGERINCLCSIISGEVESQIADDDEEKSVKFNENHDELGRFSSGTGGSAADTGDGTGAQGTSPSEPKPALPKAAEEIVKQSAKIKFQEGDIGDSVSSDDHSEIRRRMTPAERDDMDDAVSREREEWVNEQMADWEPDLDSFYDDIDEEQAANEAGYSQQDIKDSVGEMVADNEKLSKIVEDWDGRWGTDGIDMLIEELENSDDGINAELKDKLEAYKNEAEDQINAERDSQVDSLREDAERNAREEFENNFSESDAEDSYLENFYENNPERLQSDKPEKTWVTDSLGQAEYSFKTSDDRRFDVNIYPRERGSGDTKFSTHDVQFSDDSGSFSVTGKGKAFEVFGEVVPAVVAYIKHNDPEVVTFSAAGKSRMRLYDRLVATVLGAGDGRFAVKFDTPGDHRQYAVGKNALRKDIISKMPPDIQASLQEIAPKSVQDHGWEDFELPIDPTWFTPEGWPDLEEEPESKAVKYNENHDERGRFSSGDSSGDGSAVVTPEQRQANIEAAAKLRDAMLGDWANYAAMRKREEALPGAYNDWDSHYGKRMESASHLDKLVTTIKRQQGSVKAQLTKWQKKADELGQLEQDVAKNRAEGDLANAARLEEKMIALAPDVDKAFAVYKKLSDGKIDRMIETVREKIKEKFKDKLEIPAPVTLESFDEDVKKNSGEAIAKAQSILKGVVTEKIRTKYTSPSIKPSDSNWHEGKRAYFARGQNGESGDIHLPRLGADYQTVIHEFGHSLEQEPEVGAACQAFLWHRTKDEMPFSLATRYPDAGYDMWELGRDDQFKKAFTEREGSYVGKFYSHNATEVLSMGMEKLFFNPREFAEQDPEYFKFVVGVLDGSLL